LETYLQACRARVEQALEHWLPSPTLQPERLHAAMRYATLGGGKRIRAILAYAAGAALGVPPERLDGPACALELIHAYSLVHDDLPAMDDDDLRRGRPTCHKAFDEATAILAGDALQTLAFRVLCQDEGIAVDQAVRLQLIENLAYASGSRGMAGGQAIDLEAVGAELDLVQLENMHIRKTGALILASIRMGTLSRPDADPDQVRGLERYAKCVGLAFQVQDDILDVEGETAILGKTRGKDQAHSKPTYPALLGLEGAREKARLLCTEALDNLASFDQRAEPLRWLANYIIARDR
jgi:geranylgeranyl pyrophosphate synthase